MWNKQKDLEYAEMLQRNFAEKHLDAKAQNIKKAWQESVAEVQRAQMEHFERKKKQEKVEDLIYGQSLI